MIFDKILISEFHFVTLVGIPKISPLLICLLYFHQRNKWWGQNWCPEKDFRYKSRTFSLCSPSLVPPKGIWFSTNLGLHSFKLIYNLEAVAALIIFSWGWHWSTFKNIGCQGTLHLRRGHTMRIGREISIAI